MVTTWVQYLLQGRGCTTGNNWSKTIFTMHENSQYHWCIPSISQNGSAERTLPSVRLRAKKTMITIKAQTSKATEAAMTWILKSLPSILTHTNDIKNVFKNLPMKAYYNQSSIQYLNMVVVGWCISRLNTLFGTPSKSSENGVSLTANQIESRTVGSSAIVRNRNVNPTILYLVQL